MMITLVPEMWISTMHQDLDDDDIDEYGKLVIDIPDHPGDQDGDPTEIDPAEGNIHTKTELKDPQPAKETSCSIPDVEKSIEDIYQEVSPRNYRDIPIKLLLKRSFQNRYKPHKKRLKFDKTDEKDISNESLTNHNLPSLIPIYHSHQTETEKENTTHKPEITADKNNCQSIINETTLEKPNNDAETLGMNLREVLLLCQTQTTNKDKKRLEKHDEKVNVDITRESNQRTLPQKHVSNTTRTNGHNNYIKSYKKELISTHRNHTANFEQKSVITANAYVDVNKKSLTNKEIHDSNANTVILSESRTSPVQSQNRISVVSNDFLFRHQNKQVIHRNPSETASQSSVHRKESNEKSSPHRYQEAMIEFMKQKYHLPSDHIPTTENRSALHQELLKQPIANHSKSTSIEQRIPTKNVSKNTRIYNQSTKSVNNQNTTKSPVATQSSPNTENHGYNILVHRGPDINRIVITIADEAENNKNTNDKPFYSDQRVPDRESHPEPSKLKKRSYYYKEPSLRSFRRSSLTGVQKPRNSYKNRIQRPDPLEEHMQFRAQYAYPGNNYRFSPPAPAIDHYYNLPGVNNYNNVRPAFDPWEMQRLQSLSPADRLPRRPSSANVPSSQKPRMVHRPASADHREQGLYSPLNLSLKPMPVEEKSFSEMYPNYPVTLQNYH